MNLDFVKKLYNGKNCYSDHMSEAELDLLRIPSNVENIIKGLIEGNKVVFLTGNPGDGKTYIVKYLDTTINRLNVYVERDLNNVSSYEKVAKTVISCYHDKKPALLAVNEYPFLLLCKEIKKQDNQVYNEIMEAKRNIISYNISNPLNSRVAIVDLNERNLLAPDKHLISNLIDKTVSILKKDENLGKEITQNINALSDSVIKERIAKLFEMATSECRHFAVRDILGTIAYIITACDLTDDEGALEYYNAIFSEKNDLLCAIKKFDPVYLSSPDLDEALWNGSITEGWKIDVPKMWPSDSQFDDDTDGAVECFKNIKRKYYFENDLGEDLRNMQSNELDECRDIFKHFDSKKKQIKEKIVKDLNKLFLPSSEDKKQLHIWTTHRYDMSIDATVAISSKSIDASELEIQMPRPADWLNGLEYVPNHILLKPKDSNRPVLMLDMDFLQTLNAVDKGYPVSLLSPEYEQAASIFLQQIDNLGLAEDNDDGEIIIANRKKSYKRTIFIQDGKYGFEEEE